MRGKGGGGGGEVSFARALAPSFHQTRPLPTHGKQFGRPGRVLAVAGVARAGRAGQSGAAAPATAAADHAGG